jgi:surface-adhesin protein E
MPFTIRPFRRFPVQHTVAYHASPCFKLPLAYCSGFGLLLTLLVLSSGPAYGEWLWASANNQVGLTIYVDPDTIRRNGDLVKLWQLYDYKTRQTVGGDSFFSSKAQRQFDCVKQRTRLLSFTHFTGNMGSGNRVFSDLDESEWKPVAPGSVGHALWRFACSKQ